MKACRTGPCTPIATPASTSNTSAQRNSSTAPTPTSASENTPPAIKNRVLRRPHQRIANSTSPLPTIIDTASSAATTPATHTASRCSNSKK